MFERSPADERIHRRDGSGPPPEEETGEALRARGRQSHRCPPTNEMSGVHTTQPWA